MLSILKLYSHNESRIWLFGLLLAVHVGRLEWLDAHAGPGKYQLIGF